MMTGMQEIGSKYVRLLRHRDARKVNIYMNTAVNTPAVKEASVRISTVSAPSFPYRAGQIGSQ